MTDEQGSRQAPGFGDNPAGETDFGPLDPETEAGLNSGSLASDPDHDPTGVDLARMIARGARGSATAEPRRDSRRPRPGSITEPTFSGAHADRRDPQPLGRAMDRVLNERGLTTGVNLHLLLGRWEALVGELNAQHSRPEAYDEGVLTVRADSTVWATSLRAIAPKLLARFAESLGSGAVNRIEILGPVAPSWKKGRRSVEGRGPRDTYG